MSLIFAPMNEADAHAILAWRYQPPYDVYNAPDPRDGTLEDVAREMMDPRSPHFAVRETEGAPPIAFFAYGSVCEVEDAALGPYLLRPDGSLSIGLGLRPELTGQGRGLALVEVGLAFARAHYQPRLYRLFVFAWNARAIRVYERAGFAAVGEVRIAAPAGERVFIEMTRPA